MKGLLSKEYAKARYGQISWERNDANVKPGDPYPFEGRANPMKVQLDAWTVLPAPTNLPRSGQQDRVPPEQMADGSGQTADEAYKQAFYAGTTSIQAADEEGWVISVTPSGGWIPAVIAGNTGVGLSQRAQSFVTAPEDGPFNVIEPGKRPRVTLTPSLAIKDGAPFVAVSVQGGDSQDQNLLQFLLNVTEFGMTPQEAVEAPNINTFQMRSSFGQHESRPGRMLAAESLPFYVRNELRRMGYTMEYEERTSGPITAILFDRKHKTMWGAASNHGEDYGIGW
jgi:gamma-glutamyltranspeptidase/glutathione hydrolase